MITVYLAYADADRERVAQLTAAPLPTATPHTFLQQPNKLLMAPKLQHETLGLMRRCQGMIGFFSAHLRRFDGYWEIEYGRDSLMPLRLCPESSVNGSPL